MACGARVCYFGLPGLVEQKQCSGIFHVFQVSVSWIVIFMF